MAYRTESDAHGERYGGEAGRRHHVHTTRWMHDAIEMDDVAHADDAISIDEVVERLANEMTDAVHRAAEGEHDELRDFERQFVHERQLVHEQQTGTTGAPASPAARARNTFLWLAMGLAIGGIALMFVLPPAGIVCFIMAGIVGALGFVLRPRDERPEHYRPNGRSERRDA
jgi:hypothetical protein